LKPAFLQALKTDIHGEDLMIERRGRMGILIGAGAFLLATAFAGCSSLTGMGGSHVDCNIVKLQSQSGRSNDEIASALGVSVDDVAKCPPAGAVTGAEGGGDAGGSPAAEPPPAQ
jgi:hypothetical protein